MPDRYTYRIRHHRYGLHWSGHDREEALLLLSTLQEDTQPGVFVLERQLVTPWARVDPTAPENCGCYRCNEHEDRFIGDLRIQSRMYVCGLCGDKRCPRAHSHNNACVNSDREDDPEERHIY